MPTPTWTATMLERMLADAAALAADAEIIDREDWLQVTTPTRPEPSRNGIFISRLDATQVDERIAAVVQHYGERNLRFRWIVGPSSAPDDLSDRLTGAGFPVYGATLGMHMHVPPTVPEHPPAIEFRPFGLDLLDIWIKLNMRGWEHLARTAAETERLARLMLTENRQRGWVVYEDGEPVGVTVLCLLPGVGYFQGAAVLPERRRHGLYVEMIHHRLAVLHTLGIEHAVIWASEATSAGVCRRAGFVPLCRAMFHEPPPSRP